MGNAIGSMGDGDVTPRFPPFFRFFPFLFLGGEGALGM